MADIFDQITGEPTGDIFDQVAAGPNIFEQQRQEKPIIAAQAETARQDPEYGNVPQELRSMAPQFVDPTDIPSAIKF